MSEDFLIEELPKIDLNNVKIKGKKLCKDVYELLVKASLENIDLYPYLDNYSMDYMRLYQIYLGIKQDIDVSIYDNPKYTSNSMMCIREALVKGLDYKLFAKPELNDAQINTLISLLSKGVDISKFNNHEFKEPEMKFLGDRILEGSDISVYFCEKGHFCLDKMKVIKKMTEINFDFSLIDLSPFNNQQLREIYKGALSKIDYKIYINPEYSYKVMEEIRKTLELGLEVSEYSLEIDETEYINKLKSLRNDVLSSFDYLERDLNTFLGKDYKDKYNKSQIYFFKKAIIYGYNLDVLTKENYSAEQMEEIIFGLEDGLDISKYSDVKLTDIEMSNIRMQLKKTKDEIEDINNFLVKNFKNYKKKFSNKIKNLKSLEINEEALEERVLGIKKENLYYNCYIYFNDELFKIYTSKNCELSEFIEKIKNFLDELSSLGDEDLLTNIEILENLI